MNQNEEIATKQRKAVQVIYAKSASMKPEMTGELYLTSGSDEEILTYEKTSVSLKGYYAALVTMWDANATIEQIMLSQKNAVEAVSAIKREAKSTGIVARKVEFTKHNN